MGCFALGSVWLGAAMATVVAAATPARAADAAPRSTQIVSLDGEAWLLAPDPKNVGRQEGWSQAPRPEAKRAKVPWIIRIRFPATMAWPGIGATSLPPRIRTRMGATGCGSGPWTTRPTSGSTACRSAGMKEARRPSLQPQRDRPQPHGHGRSGDDRRGPVDYVPRVEAGHRGRRVRRIRAPAVVPVRRAGQRVPQDAGAIGGRAGQRRRAGARQVRGAVPGGRARCDASVREDAHAQYPRSKGGPGAAHGAASLRRRRDA